MKNWRTSDLLPDHLISVRQFTTSSRWYEVRIWDGIQGHPEQPFVCTGKNEQQAIKAAIANLKGQF